MNKFNKILCILLAIVITLTPSRVLAFDNDYFYNTNDILFYDSEYVDCYSGGSISLVGNDNLEKILRYYVGKGLTLTQASGIAGNYQQESGFNPAKIQGGNIADSGYSPVNGVGFGIAQWTFSSRQNPLINLSLSENKEIIDLSLQLDYSWNELNGSHAKALDTIKETTTPEDAAYVFHRDYEGSADSEEKVKEVRGGNAIAIYNTFKTAIADGSTSTSGYSDGCSGDGTPSEYIDGFAIFNQYDPQWANEPFGSSTISAAGCGPSAMAMAIKALTGINITPVDTANFGSENNLYVEGAGSSWSIAPKMSENWGLTATNIGGNIADINAGLRDGGIIITSGAGSSPFTSSGHYILIRAVTENGMWLVADSNGQKGIDNSSVEYDPTTLINSGMRTENVWLIKK